MRTYYIREDNFRHVRTIIESRHIPRPVIETIASHYSENDLKIHHDTGIRIDDNWCEVRNAYYRDTEDPGIGIFRVDNDDLDEIVKLIPVFGSWAGIAIKYDGTIVEE